MKNNKIFLNGQLMDLNQASFSVLDRGYLFGEGVFETLRSYRGILPFFDKHMQRLEWTTSFLGIPCPHPSELKKIVLDLLAENKLADARIKIVISAIGESLTPTVLTDLNDINLLVSVEPFQKRSDEEYEQGVNLIVVHSIRNDPPPASTLKTTSRLVKTMATREIKEKDAFDGILLDAHGYVTETTYSNIFWVEGETLMTSPTSLGLLPGVTRDVMIELAKDEGLLFEEKMMTPDTLKKQSEIFITGSTLEVMPVVQVDDKVIGSGEPGRVTKSMMEAYQERLAAEIEDEKDSN